MSALMRPPNRPRYNKTHVTHLPMIEFIDLKTQQARIKGEIDAAIARVLAHGQYILGPEVAELEERLQQYTGAKHCITVANGTDALQIAQMADRKSVV